MANCTICNRTLDNPRDKLSADCGGDCLKCMADAGDPECVKAIKYITLSKAAKKLADEAFKNMVGGKGHLISDVYSAIEDLKND